MRHSIVRCLVLAAVLLSSFPAPAHAAMGAGFWRWWDSLSGPGPFQGAAFDADIVCIGDNVFRDKPDRVSLLDCWQVEQKLHLSLGTDIGVLRGRNNLDPQGSSVTALPVFGAARVGNHKFDAGVDVGFIHFSAENAGANVFAWGPRLTIRPFAFLSERPVARVVNVRWFATNVPGTLTGADFGVPTSTWTGGNEWLEHGFAITIDLSVLRPSVRSR
jgi:hypothetical protein